MRTDKIIAILSFTLLAGYLSGCSTLSYYGQSIQGQMNLLLNRESIDDILAQPETSPELKLSLQQARSIRQYASAQLSLPDNKSYLYYVDVKRPYVVWNVFAAPEFSLNPTNWCYPIAGCVSYRGYFAEEDAIEQSEELKLQNLDVHVGGIAAYSTLGWFDDPLMNTMLHWRQRSLAGLIFHELSHQVIYIKSETGFNEAFSSSVERLGTIQWLLAFYPTELDAYIAYLNAQSDFRDLLLQSREKLITLYHSSVDEELKRNEKQFIIEQMQLDYVALKESWPKNIHFDRWFEKPINNARLTSAMTYLNDIPAFYQLFIEAEGNWADFYDTVIALENLEPEDRQRLIENKAKSEIDYVTLVKLIRKNTDLD